MDDAKSSDLEQDTKRAAADDVSPAEPSVEAEAGDEPDPLEAARQRCAKLQDENMRLAAEVRNTHQRAQREKADALKYAEADFARELLIVLDDLERTLQSARDGANQEALADGVRIVYEHFLKVLDGRHIKPIEAVGKKFDPHFHEAMMQQPSDDHEAGIVLQELQRGYVMLGRVIRSTRVIVSSGKAPADADTDDNAPEED